MSDDHPTYEQVMDHDREETADAGFRISIPRTISWGNLLSLGGGLLVAFAAWTFLVQYKDSVDNHFAKLDNHLSAADDNHAATMTAIDTLDRKVGDISVNITRQMDDLKSDISEIKGELKVRKAGAELPHPNERPGDKWAAGASDVQK